MTDLCRLCGQAACMHPRTEAKPVAVKLYVIDEWQLNTLRQAAKRLYSENRMDGDAMRSMAQRLDAVVHVCEQIEVPVERAAPDALGRFEPVNRALHGPGHDQLNRAEP